MIRFVKAGEESQPQSETAMPTNVISLQSVPIPVGGECSAQIILAGNNFFSVFFIVFLSQRFYREVSLFTKDESELTCSRIITSFHHVFFPPHLGVRCMQMFATSGRHRSEA